MEQNMAAATRCRSTWWTSRPSALARPRCMGPRPSPTPTTATTASSWASEALPARRSRPRRMSGGRRPEACTRPLRSTLTVTSGPRTPPLCRSWPGRCARPRGGAGLRRTRRGRRCRGRRGATASRRPRRGPTPRAGRPHGRRRGRRRVRRRRRMSTLGEPVPARHRRSPSATGTWRPHRGLGHPKARRPTAHRTTVLRPVLRRTRAVRRGWTLTCWSARPGGKAIQTRTSLARLRRRSSPEHRRSSASRSGRGSSRQRRRSSRPSSSVMTQRVTRPKGGPLRCQRSFSSRSSGPAMGCRKAAIGQVAPPIAATTRVWLQMPTVGRSQRRPAGQRRPRLPPATHRLRRSSGKPCARKRRNLASASALRTCRLRPMCTRCAPDFSAQRSSTAGSWK
mmetsp:Transcript_336/g.1195  ORF Transcript_336/g.1195 Transcript_336/m.1195 type:complete len:395 (-) Transcript_336:1068-2252(-)